MFTWKVEELKLYKECGGNAQSHIFKCEAETSHEDKIAFVDSLADGELSYALDLINKLQQDKDTLALDEFNDIKTVSLIAWVKRNDTKYQKPIVDICCNYGMIKIFGVARYIQKDIVKKWNIYDDYVDEVFHNALVHCCFERELRYFLTHDDYSVLKERIRNRGFKSTFGVKLTDYYTGDMVIEDEDGNERPITIDELIYLDAKCAQVQALIEKITTETNITY